MKTKLVKTAVGTLAATVALTFHAQASTPTPSVTYTRGKDLSGTLEGAGGIGGLLARTDNQLSTLNPPHSTAFYHSDGNGNVTALINSAQQLLAKYQYDPFGNTISFSGPLASANTYRFSTKETDDRNGLYAFGYRFYSPTLEKWANRDPLAAEAPEDSDGHSEPFELDAGSNPYHYAHNDPFSQVDPLGLDIWVIRDKCGKWGHEWVVGSNGDGTYWQSDKNPGNHGFRLPYLNCPADIRFYPKSTIDPTKLGKCYKITRHIVTSPGVDAKARDRAKKNADEDRGRWDACGSNCRDYANGVADFGLGAKIREMRK